MSKYGPLTEEEFIALMKDIVKGYGWRYSWTYQGPEDVEQQCYIHAYDGLADYSPEKGDIKRFLRVHVRNRLMNDKRKFFARNDIPCKNCPLKAFVKKKCTAFQEPELECPHLAPWFKRNQSRIMIAQPIGLSEVDPLGESAMEIDAPPEADMEWAEIWEKIERDLPEELEDIYHIWKTGFREGQKRRTNLNAKDTEAVEEWIKERVGYLFE